MARFSEIDIIKIARELSSKSTSLFDSFITVEIGDDSFNFLPPGGYEISITSDTLIEDVHFKREWADFIDIGWKSCTVSLSDLASMGAQPAFLLLNIGIPEHLTLSQVKKVIEGLVTCALRYQSRLTGGDTVRSDKIVVSVTAIGFVEKGKSLKRSAAESGMKIFVSGSLGASAAGILLLQERNLRKRFPKKICNYLISKQIKPEAQIELGRKLVASGVRVCEDVSDGLAREVINICKASRTGARIYEEKIPLDKNAVKLATVKGISPTRLALSGGEDYQLVFAANDEEISRLKELLRDTNINISEIGEVLKLDSGLSIIRKNGSEEPLRGGFDHFKKETENTF